MLRVLLLHLDGSPAMPNLALMVIYAHHVRRGDHVELRVVRSPAALQPRLGDPAWDVVYGSLIFEKTRPLAELAMRIYPHIHIGGTGWAVTSNLRDVGIDDAGPVDYAGYPQFKRSIGFSMRGCRLECRFCVVPRKEGKARANQHHLSRRIIPARDPAPRQRLLWTPQLERRLAGAR